MEPALEVAFPIDEEAPQHREIGADVGLLPNEALQQGGEVRHMVEDLGRRQAVVLEGRSDNAHGLHLLAVVPLTSPPASHFPLSKRRCKKKINRINILAA